MLAENTWEFIKNATLAPVLLLIDLVTGDFERLKSDLENILNNIKNAFTNIWTAIQSITENFWDAIKTVILTKVEMTNEIVSTLLNALKTQLENIWNQYSGIHVEYMEQYSKYNKNYGGQREKFCNQWV